MAAKYNLSSGLDIATDGYLLKDGVGLATDGYLTIFVVITGGGSGGDFNLGIISETPIDESEEEEIIMLVIKSFLQIWG